VPPWCKYTQEEVKSIIIDLAKHGHSPSEIGLILRDQYGIPLVKPFFKKGIVRILEEAGLAPKVPEDLNNLLKKARRLRRHLEKHRKDKKNVHSLELLESRIHRLAKYYKRKGILPPDWRYKAVIVRAA
jgi:small subunit ribosomal protein S15